MGEPGDQPFPWLLVLILTACLCVGFAVGVYAVEWILP